MSIIDLFITVLLLGAVFWLLWWALAKIPLAEPFKTIATWLLIFGSVVILILLLTGRVAAPHYHL